ncbi:alpha/beta fold hydrolase [Microlunatus capsulatus]|uniref:alpha/beta fold hydrolase n=1 Tax=Microlunatus capsulatus TaxID=99117 RepID=UPI003557AB94
MAAAPFVLVPGYWLGGWAWERVAPLLRAAGHPVSTPTLPGLEPEPARRPPGVTLEDHVAAVADAVRAAGPSAVLVAHSGAGKLATAVLDRDPAAVARVVYVDSGPAADGLAEPLPDGADRARAAPVRGAGGQPGRAVGGRSAGLPRARRAAPRGRGPRAAAAARPRATRGAGHPRLLLAPGRDGPGAGRGRAPDVRRGGRARRPDGGRPPDGALADVEPARRARRGAAGGRRRRALG